MADKVTIKLTPYTALAILKFCREFVNDDVKDDMIFKSLYDAVAEYEQEIYNNVTDKQLEDAIAETQVNMLIGTAPGK